MNIKLDASNYDYINKNYAKEFQRVLRGIYACYKKMLKDKVKLPNDENEIRNCLLINYLRNDSIRKNTDLSGFLFERESPEDNTNGRVDIKISTLRTFKESEAYYIIECKRLDNENTKGNTGLNAEYIKKGIYRFVTKKYSSYHRINAMIGFIVENMEIQKNKDNINFLLNKLSDYDCKTTKYLSEENFIPDFEFHYSSEHNDIENKNIMLYHIMLDFSKLIYQKPLKNAART